MQQAKALKQKANKQLEALGRRHLRDVRIVRKDMVYVTGMRMTSGDKEEVSPLQRSQRARRWTHDTSLNARLVRAFVVPLAPPVKRLFRAVRQDLQDLSPERLVHLGPLGQLAQLGRFG